MIVVIKSSKTLEFQVIHWGFFQWKELTARKVFKYRVLSGLYFPAFNPNAGKYGPEKTPYLDNFHAVSDIFVCVKGLCPNYPLSILRQNQNAFAMLVYEIQGDLMQALEAFMICLAERNTMKIYFLSLFVIALVSQVSITDC